MTCELSVRPLCSSYLYFCHLIFHADAQQHPEPIIMAHQEDEEEVGSTAGFVVATPGCRIPDLDARSPLVKKYVSALEPRPKVNTL